MSDTTIEIQANDGTVFTTARGMPLFGDNAGVVLETVFVAAQIGASSFHRVTIPESEGLVGRHLFYLGDSLGNGATFVVLIADRFVYELFAGQSTEIIDGVLAGLGSVTVTRVGPNYDPATSTFELIAGDDYLFDNDGHTDFSIGFDGDPEGWTVRVSASSKYPSKFTGVGSLVNAGSEYMLRVEWAKSQTNTQPGNYTWQAKVIDPAGNVRTKIEGPLCLKASTD